ncbi:MAG: ABC transporter permease, partial [Pyrinomonadaceae bacterium]
MLIRDLRYGLRQLHKNPGFTIVAITTLALGIGLTGAMFTIIYAILLRPLPFQKSAQIVMIGQAYSVLNNPSSTSLPIIRDWREQSKSFQDIAYWNFSFHNIVNNGKTELVPDIQCSVNLFSLLQVRPILGRTFFSDEYQPGKSNVVVLSARAWKNFFSSDPDIIGHLVEVDANYYSVIGVMPDNFSFPLTHNGSFVWTPLQPKKEWEDRSNATLQVVGRLKNGVTNSAAQAELTKIVNKDATESSSDRALIKDYRELITGDVRPALLSLEGAVLAIWLIACINVVGLQSTRAMSRRRETAIRCALGANQGRLLRQFFAESALLGGLAGLLGLLLCFGFLRAMRFYLVSRLPFADTIQVNIPVVAVIFVLSLISTLLFGMWPALQSYWTLPQEALHDGTSSAGTSRHQRRLQDGLVVCEVALSLVLLLSAGLLLRTLYNLRTTSLGFVPDHLIVAELPLYLGGYTGKDVIASVYDSLLQRLEQMPGVKSAAISSILPMAPNSTARMPVEIFGRPNPSKQASNAEFRIVSSDLYRT